MTSKIPPRSSESVLQAEADTQLMQGRGLVWFVPGTPHFSWTHSLLKALGWLSGAWALGQYLALSGPG